MTRGLELAKTAVFWSVTSEIFFILLVDFVVDFTIFNF